MWFSMQSVQGQEPVRTEIKEFCSTKFGVSFLYSKIDVNGPNDTQFMKI